MREENNFTYIKRSNYMFQVQNYYVKVLVLITAFTTHPAIYIFVFQKVKSN